jgi:hypothetical protein
VLLLLLLLLLPQPVLLLLLLQGQGGCPVHGREAEVHYLAQEAGRAPCWDAVLDTQGLAQADQLWRAGRVARTPTAGPKRKYAPSTRQSLTLPVNCGIRTHLCRLA